MTNYEPELARFVECPRCGGEGEWEGAPYGVDYRDGSVLADLITCSMCGGTGCIEEDAQPVTQDDLDEIEAQEELGERRCPARARLEERDDVRGCDQDR